MYKFPSADRCRSFGQVDCRPPDKEFRYLRQNVTTSIYMRGDVPFLTHSSCRQEVRTVSSSLLTGAMFGVQSLRIPPTRDPMSIFFLFPSDSVRMQGVP